MPLRVFRGEQEIKLGEDSPLGSEWFKPYSRALPLQFCRKRFPGRAAKHRKPGSRDCTQEDALGLALVRKQRERHQWPTGLPQRLGRVCQPEPGDIPARLVSRHSPRWGGSGCDRGGPQPVRQRGGGNLERRLEQGEAPRALPDRPHADLSTAAGAPAGRSPALTRCRTAPPASAGVRVPRGGGASALQLWQPASPAAQPAATLL